MNTAPDFLQHKLTYLSHLIVAFAMIARLAGLQVPDQEALGIISFTQAHWADFVAFSGLVTAFYGKFRSDLRYFKLQYVHRQLVREAFPLLGTSADANTPAQKATAPDVGKIAGLLLMLCLVNACTIHPSEVTNRDGTRVAWLGGSLATKATDESASITRLDGTVLSYHRSNGDETVVPVAVTRAQVLKAGISAGASVAKAATAAATKTPGIAAPALIGAAVGAGGVGLASPSPSPSPATPKPNMP